MKRIAVITARAGSKGLKDKNIKLLGGIPLLAHAINVARNSGCFDCVHLSTDSELYAEIGRQYGADVPFLRDQALAGDNSDPFDAVRAGLKKYLAAGRAFDSVMVLQPTSPLRTVEDIKNSIALMEAKNANAIVSVSEVPHPPQWCAELPENGDMFVYHHKLLNMCNRQDFQQQYIINGAIFLSKVDYFFESKSIFESGCYAYIMPQERSFDVDTPLDFEWCEFLLARKNLEKGQEKR